MPPLQNGGRETPPELGRPRGPGGSERFLPRSDRPDTLAPRRARSPLAPGRPPPRCLRPRPHRAPVGDHGGGRCRRPADTGGPAPPPASPRLGTKRARKVPGQTARLAAHGPAAVSCPTSGGPGGGAVEAERGGCSGCAAGRRGLLPSKNFLGSAGVGPGPASPRRPAGALRFGCDTGDTQGRPPVFGSENTGAPRLSTAPSRRKRSRRLQPPPHRGTSPLSFGVRVRTPRRCPPGRRTAAVCHVGASRPQRVAASPRLPVPPLLPMRSPRPSAPLSGAGSQGDALRQEAGGDGAARGEAVSPPLAGRGPLVRDKQDGAGVERALVSSPLPPLPKGDHRQSRPRLPAAGKPLSPRPGRRARSRGVTESRGRPPASRKLPLNQSCPSPARSPLRPAASLCARLEPCPAPGSSGAHRGGRFGAAAAAFGACRAPGVLCRDGPAGWEGRRRGGLAPGS
ncbi:translation initiation factor IF-2-like [Cygnus atratus]|uniref:translation initiation factor IF-2-like n=1 Tax=Cygnus atratus TaxID=8868 RepID=UPI0021B8043A|nr:translation initiation factor IF-2-like [Cygnus atratus]